MKNLIYFLISLSLLNGFSPKASAQKPLSVEELHDYADSVLGPPDLAGAGKKDLSWHQSICRRPTLIFSADSFTDATLFIKDLKYEDIPVLIDLEKDQLVMRYSIKDVLSVHHAFRNGHRFGACV